MQYIPTILSIVTWAFTALCWWKVFTKANIAGWKAIIPFYCDYNRFKLGGKKNWYFPYLFLTIAKQIYSIVALIILFVNVIEFLQNGVFDGAGLEMKSVSWGLLFLIMIFDVYIGIHIAQRFHKSNAFGVGLGLIPIVFVPVLAFGKAEYEGKEWI